MNWQTKLALFALAAAFCFYSLLRLDFEFFWQWEVLFSSLIALIVIGALCWEFILMSFEAVKALFLIISRTFNDRS